MAASVGALILVTGASPGLGKSSLAAKLVMALRADGLDADLFREEDIMSDAAFSEVMDEFQSREEVQLDTLLAAADAYLTSAHELSADALVLDALLPYLTSLLAWGYTDDDIAVFFDRLARSFVGFGVIQLHLVGDVRNALTRASDREGGDWLARHLAKVARYRTLRPIVTLEDLVAYYDDCAARSRALLAAAPWRAEFIDAGPGEESVLALARAAMASGDDRT